jgi:hypothetical protein
MTVHWPAHERWFLIRVGCPQCQHHGVELSTIHNAFNPDLLRIFGLAYDAEIGVSAFERSEPARAPCGERTMRIIPDPAGTGISDCGQDGVEMALRYIGHQGM